jgi:ADP-heptose:LPS heptosyltransferase
MAGPALQAPRSILMIKAHSAGIGDLLRSSAAWRALRSRFPAARLHLWFLTKDPGAPAEQLIARHHLLAGFCVSDKRTRGFAGWKKLLADGRKIGEETRPDLIVDFEPNGLRTSLLAWRQSRRTHGITVGIAQAPLRGCFYNRLAPSTEAYAWRRGMTLPLEYTERDFVALAALGIERDGTPIELRETEEGQTFRARLSAELGAQAGQPLLGLNIGCGTPDALAKRPSLDFLAALVTELQRRKGFALILTGASYEQEINREFLTRFRPSGPVLDLAGRTNLLELTGAIAACRLFISSDSGPYHMAVGLRVPTLALFNQPNPQHYHHHPWVQCFVEGRVSSLPKALEACERLLSITPPPLPP